MADAPWRCSECGTINEPVANACRTCGRWPSLFDLEQSTIEADAPVDEDEFAARTVDEEQLEPEVFDVGRASEEVEMPPEFEPEVEPETEPPKPLWRRLGSVIVPIGVVVYLLIMALANRGG